MKYRRAEATWSSLTRTAAHAWSPQLTGLPLRSARSRRAGNRLRPPATSNGSSGGYWRWVQSTAGPWTKSGCATPSVTSYQTRRSGATVEFAGPPERAYCRSLSSPPYTTEDRARASRHHREVPPRLFAATRAQPLSHAAAREADYRRGVCTPECGDARTISSLLSDWYRQRRPALAFTLTATSMPGRPNSKPRRVKISPR